MIQKLRRKFILINMSLVTLVLLIVFTAVCTSSYRRLAGESVSAMRQALERGVDNPPPKFEFGRGHPRRPPPAVPVLSVALDGENKIFSVNRDRVEISDEALSQAVERALADGRGEGVLSGMDLRFLRQDMPDGVKIAFADRSAERESMKNLVLTSLLVGLGGIGAFFLISLFLSRWALLPVQQAWEQQRRFVADASHELKTPLTVILANTGILLSHREDSITQQLKWVEYTRDEANRMKKLVDDLLFLAKNDAGRAPAVCGEVGLSDLVWSCLLPFESVAFEQGVALQSEISPLITVIGDENQLRQLVVILLDNACKYAGDGGTITLSLRRSQDHAVLCVHNTGAPISKEHLAHLFERFYRADPSRTRGGYGLGLAIAQSIVQGHKGRIEVVSRAESGTDFVVYLPLETVLKPRMQVRLGQKRFPAPPLRRSKLK